MSGPKLREVGRVRFGHLCDCDRCDEDSNPTALVTGYRAECCGKPSQWQHQHVNQTQVVSALVDHLRDAHGIQTVSTLLVTPVKVCPSCDGMAVFGAGCDCVGGLVDGEPVAVDVPLDGSATELALPGVSP